MCPVCFSSVDWLITGGVFVLGATAGGVAIVRDRKIATRISKIWKLRTREPLPSCLVFRGLKTNVAPRGSAWTRARAGAGISESIGIPPHLSLPGRSILASVFVHDHHALGHIEKATKRQHPTKEKEAMRTQVMHSGADELEVQRRDICAQHASQVQQ
jgi:hypothetical protein